MTEIIIELAWSYDMSDTLQPVLTSANKTWRYFLLKYCYGVDKNVGTAMAYTKRSVFIVETPAAALAATTSASSAARIIILMPIKMEHLRPKHHCPPELPCNKTMNTFISWKPFGKTKDFLSTSYLY